MIFFHICLVIKNMGIKNVFYKYLEVDLLLNLNQNLNRETIF